MSSAHRTYPLQSWRAAKDAAVDAAEMSLADAVLQLQQAGDAARAARETLARCEQALAHCEARVRDLVHAGCAASEYASARHDEDLARKQAAQARLELERWLAQCAQRQQHVDLAHRALAEEQANRKAVEKHAEQWAHAQARAKQAAAQDELDEYAATALANVERAKTG